MDNKIILSVLITLCLLNLTCGQLQAAQQGRGGSRLGRVFEKDENGYVYSYGTRNGDVVEQSAAFKPGPILEDGTQEKIPVVRGSYSFVDNFGKLHEVKYEADENGFRVLN